MKFSFGAKDIGIDLGTSYTSIYLKGKGIVLREPSVVAVDMDRKKIVAVGSKASRMIGRTPAGVQTLKPLKDGVIANFDMTQEMLRYFIHQANKLGAFINSRHIILSHPSVMSEIDKKMVSEVPKAAGMSKVILIEDPVAAAMGAGISVDEPAGAMIVDIGGGTTDIAVISMGGIVNSKTLKIAGDKMDHAIINYMKKKHQLTIGEKTAESVKITIGNAYLTGDEGEERHKVKGGDLKTGLPRFVEVSAKEINAALNPLLNQIVDSIKATLEESEPELSADIMEMGITLTGGGGMLRGLGEFIYSKIKVPVKVAEAPMECVALGTGKCLDMIDKLLETKVH